MFVEGGVELTGILRARYLLGFYLDFCRKLIKLLRSYMIHWWICKFESGDFPL